LELAPQDVSFAPPLEQLPIPITTANIKSAPSAPTIWLLIDRPFSFTLEDPCAVVECLSDKLSCVIFSSCVASAREIAWEQP
jgi:hypothetical protein